MNKINFKNGKWQFDSAMEHIDWDEEKFDEVLEKTAKELDAAEVNEFWKQYNKWKRKCNE